LGRRVRISAEPHQGQSISAIGIATLPLIIPDSARALGTVGFGQATMSLSLTQKWLKQVLAPYPNKDHIYTDINSALAAHSTLRPKNDVYSEFSLF
jgi:hypothetical protein